MVDDIELTDADYAALADFRHALREFQAFSEVRVAEYGLTPPGLAWIMVRLDIHFRAELHWPNKIELGLGVVKLGRTSVTFEQVVFSEGKCIASAMSVGVMLDEATRRPAPLTAEIIEKLRPWHKRGIEVAPPSA